MLDITFHSADEALARQMQDDLSQRSFRLEHAVMLVLLTPAALADDAVAQAVNKARKAGVRLAPIVVKPLTGALPAPYAELPVYDLSKASYDPKKLLAFVNRVDLGEARLARNRRLFFFIFAGAVIMFAAAIWGVGSGMVRFPSEEYATDSAIEFAQIQTLTFPTLDPLMPRTTEDALNFPATVEAASTRNRPYLRETATALPLGVTQTLGFIATSAELTLTAQSGNALNSATPTAEATSTATP